MPLDEMTIDAVTDAQGSQQPLMAMLWPCLTSFHGQASVNLRKCGAEATL
jgi:hypothetical protein